MFEYLPELMKGLHTSLTLTVASLIVALILALIFTMSCPRCFFYLSKPFSSVLPSLGDAPSPLMLGIWLAQS